MVLVVAVALANLEIWNIEHPFASEPCLEVGSNQSEATSSAQTLPVVYHPRYNIQILGMEFLHVFDSKKHAKIAAVLKDRADVTLLRPCGEISQEELSLVHSPGHLAVQQDALGILRILNMPAVLASVLPAAFLNRYILRPHRHQVQGTLLAVELAMRHGAAVNLGGGFHHAAFDHGSGFCFFDDVSLALSKLQRRHKLQRVWVVDMDLHQSNGVARAIGKLRSTPGSNLTMELLDVFCGVIFPFDFEAERHISVQRDVCQLADVGLSSQEARTEAFASLVGASSSQVYIEQFHTDDSYMKLVKDALKELKERPRPDLIVYNAGSDVLKDDPLNGALHLSPAGLRRRDQLVFDFAHKLKVPIVMLLSGGYGPSSATAIAASVSSLAEQRSQRK